MGARYWSIINYDQYKLINNIELTHDFISDKKKNVWFHKRTASLYCEEKDKMVPVSHFLNNGYRLVKR